MEAEERAGALGEELRAVQEQLACTHKELQLARPTREQAYKLQLTQGVSPHQLRLLRQNDWGRGMGLKDVLESGELAQLAVGGRAGGDGDANALHYVPTRQEDEHNRPYDAGLVQRGLQLMIKGGGMTLEQLSYCVRETPSVVMSEPNPHDTPCPGTWRNYTLLTWAGYK
jgi:hypothetical protein